MEKSSDWSDKCPISQDDLPGELKGIPKMEGYVATFFSGSMANPDGKKCGSFNAFRECVNIPKAESGRVKKYEYAIYLDDNNTPQVFVIKEISKKAIKGHHSPELEDEYLKVWLE